jgi:uncharacterized protein (DUF2147 family)
MMHLRRMSDQQRSEGMRMIKARSILMALMLIGMTARVAAAEGVIGEWLTEEDEARVTIAACEDNADLLCGKMVWLKDPKDADGKEFVVDKNPVEALRSNPVVGLQILEGFTQDSDTDWSGGTFYDPESGKTYKSKMKLKSANELVVDGCVLIVCRGQDWRRYEG